MCMHQQFAFTKYTREFHKMREWGLQSRSQAAVSDPSSQSEWLEFLWALAEAFMGVGFWQMVLIFHDNAASKV